MYIMRTRVRMKKMCKYIHIHPQPLNTHKRKATFMKLLLHFFYHCLMCLQVRRSHIGVLGTLSPDKNTCIVNIGDAHFFLAFKKDGKSAPEFIHGLPRVLSLCPLSASAKSQLEVEEAEERLFNERLALIDAMDCSKADKTLMQQKLSVVVARVGEIHNSPRRDEYADLFAQYTLFDDSIVDKTGWCMPSSVLLGYDNRVGIPFTTRMDEHEGRLEAFMLAVRDIRHAMFEVDAGAATRLIPRKPTGKNAKDMSPSAVSEYESFSTYISQLSPDAIASKTSTAHAIDCMSRRHSFQTEMLLADVLKMLPGMSFNMRVLGENGGSSLYDSVAFPRPTSLMTRQRSRRLFGSTGWIISRSLRPFP